LRPARDRYNSETKTLIPTAVESILTAESFLTTHYGKSAADSSVAYNSIEVESADSGNISKYSTLYDFITVDCSGGNDHDPSVKRIKKS
jgi:hypothetical protein